MGRIVVDGFSRHVRGLVVVGRRMRITGCHRQTKVVSLDQMGPAATDCVVRLPEVGGELRASLATVQSLAMMDDLLGQLDWTQPYPGADAEGQRGRAGTPQNRVALPDGWLDSQETDERLLAIVRLAELSVSGG